MKNYKRILSALFLVTAALVFYACNNVLEVTVEAQSFPVTVHAEMDPPLVSDGVTLGNFSLDTTPAVSFPVVAATCIVGTASVPCVKTGPISVPDNKVHTLAVTWTNQWGPSLPMVITFQIKVAATPTNGTVKGGAQ